jgi:hypothetical protein
LAHEIITESIENRKNLGGGVLVSERKRISGLWSLISILSDRTAAGLERPLQFQEMIFMRVWGTDQCPLTWWRKELRNQPFFLFWLL